MIDNNRLKNALDAMPTEETLNQSSAFSAMAVMGWFRDYQAEIRTCLEMAMRTVDEDVKRAIEWVDKWQYELSMMADDDRYDNVVKKILSCLRNSQPAHNAGEVEQEAIDPEIEKVIKEEWLRIKPSHVAQCTRARIKLDSGKHKHYSEADLLPEWVWSIADIAAEMALQRAGFKPAPAENSGPVDDDPDLPLPDKLRLRHLMTEPSVLETVDDKPVTGKLPGFSPEEIVSDALDDINRALDTARMIKNGRSNYQDVLIMNLLSAQNKLDIQFPHYMKIERADLVQPSSEGMNKNYTKALNDLNEFLASGAERQWDDVINWLCEHKDTVRAALSNSVPDGMVLVTREPDGNMWSIGRKEYITQARWSENTKTAEEQSVLYDTAATQIYKKMIAAYEQQTATEKGNIDG